MSVTNELRHLALYLDELIDTGNGLEVGSSLYEQVQYNNSIIPRLYLMITVTGMNEHIFNPYRQIPETISEKRAVTQGISRKLFPDFFQIL